jgi:hypothetical protein
MSILYNGSYANTSNQLWANYQTNVTTPLSLSNVTAGSSVTLSNLLPNNTYNMRFNLLFSVSNSVTFSNLIDGTNQYSLAVSATNPPLELNGFVANSSAILSNLIPIVPSSPYFKKDSGTGCYLTDSVILTPQTTSLTFSFLNLSPSPSVATNLINCYGNIAIQHAS